MDFGIRKKRTLFKVAVVGASLFAIDFTRDLFGVIFRYKLFGLASVSTIFGVVAILYLIGQYKNWW